MRHVLLTEPLVDEFAALFKGVTNEEIDELMNSFRFASCIQRSELARTLAGEAGATA